METKKIDIKWDGKDEVVVMKKLKFGELNRLRASATKVSIINKQEKIEVDQVAMIENSLLKGIVSAPWNTNDVKVLQDIDAELGMKLYEEFNLLNGVIPKKSVSSSTSSQAEKPATKK